MQAWGRRAAAAALVPTAAGAITTVVLLWSVQASAHQWWAFADGRRPVVLVAASAAVLVVVSLPLALHATSHARWAAALALGVVAVAPVWEGWPGGPTAVRTLGLALAPLGVAAAAVALPAAGGWSSLRSVVLRVTAVAATVAVGRVLLLDPARRRSCWPNCAVNDVLVVESSGATRAVEVMAALVTAGCALVVVAAAAAAVLRDADTAVTLPVLAVVVVALGYAVPVELAWSGGVPVLTTVRSLGLVLVGLCLVGASARDALGARALARTVTRWRAHGATGRSPAEEMLRRRLGDPRLRLGHVVDGVARAADGTVVAEPAGGERRTRVRLGPDDVLEITHRASPRRVADAVGALGPVARLALADAHAAAALRVEVARLGTAREREVTAARVVRSRAERDLHDGVQHTLLALRWRAVAASTEEPDPERARRWSELAAAATAAMAAVRDISHGLDPVVLRDAGLVVALEPLVTRGTVLVRGEPPQGGLPPVTERAAWDVVRAAGGRSAVAIRFGPVGAPLVVVVEDADDDLAQRVDDLAAGARGSASRDGTRVRVELPCA